MPYSVDNKKDVEAIKDRLQRTYQNVDDKAARQAIHVWESVYDKYKDEGRAYAGMYAVLNKRLQKRQRAASAELVALLHMYRDAARPGPQWDPWPRQSLGMQEALEFLEWQLSHPQHNDLSPAGLRSLKGLVDSLRKEDRRRAKGFAQDLDSEDPGFVTNTVWSYILDGRQASRQHPVGQLDGFARDITKRDLDRLRMSVSLNPSRPRLETTRAHESKEDALRDAEKIAKDYERSHWPGGMTEVVGLIEFPMQPNDDEDGGVWVGVVNLYYSPS